MRARRSWLLGLLSALTACGGAATLPPPRETPGRAVLVTAAALPEGHPEVLVGEPESMEGHAGRAPRRLSVDQLRASLLAATGHTWVASRRVSDPDSPSGSAQLPDADMLEALAATLGRPDYLSSTSEAIDPAVTFAKLASDAARSACRAAVNADLKAEDHARNVVRFAGPLDTVAANPSAIKKNLAYLALRFWGRTLSPEDPALAPLLALFGTVSTLPHQKDASGAERPKGSPADGWRAVCIAMATDSQFLLY